VYIVVYVYTIRTCQLGTFTSAALKPTLLIFVSTHVPPCVFVHNGNAINNQ